MLRQIFRGLLSASRYSRVADQHKGFSDGGNRKNVVDTVGLRRLTGNGVQVSGAGQSISDAHSAALPKYRQKRMTVHNGRSRNSENPEGQLRKIGGTRRANEKDSTAVCRQWRSGWWIYVEPVRERPMLQALPATAGWETFSSGNGTPRQTWGIHCASICSRPPAATFGGTLLAL